LDAPVERYLPDFRLQGRFVPRSITLRHLLQHRSGLRQWDGHDERAQRHGTFDHLAPAGPPGAEGRYSSLNYIILGQVLRASTGRTYADNLGRLLFEPLELHSTFVAGDSASASGERARGHQSWFGVQVSRDEPTPPPFLVPAGFIGLSAHDLGRYSGMLLGGGTFAGQRVLDSTAVAALLGPLDTSGVSLGWGRRRVNGELYLEHKGNARTTSARMRLLPERGYAITVLATTNSGPFFDATDQVMHNIQRIIEQGHAPAPWPGERLFKGIVLAGTVLSVGSMLHQANRWRRAGAPIGVDGSRQSLGRLTFDVAAGGFILFGVPRLIGVPISTLGEYFPDLGIALGVSAGAGILGGVLRAFTATARPAS
jgi:CubicO group peptidase (beta-lactamase class C family)